MSRNAGARKGLADFDGRHLLGCQADQVMTEPNGMVSRHNRVAKVSIHGVVSACQ